MTTTAGADSVLSVVLFVSIAVFFLLMLSAIFRTLSAQEELYDHSRRISSEELETQTIIDPDSIPVYRLNNSSMVVTSGYLKPKIWIGDRLNSRDELQSAIAHEMAHIARGDQFTLLLIVVLERLNWWNPLAWHLGRLARTYMEYRADELSVGALGTAAYQRGLAETLMKSNEQGSVLFTHLGNKPNVVERMENLNMNKKLRMGHGVAIFLSLAAMVASATALTDDSDKFQTLDSCHSLLPASGDYRLKITSIRNSEGGEMSVSFVDLGDQEWETPPPEVAPFLECVRVVVGVIENEGWPGT